MEDASDLPFGCRLIIADLIISYLCELQYQGFHTLNFLSEDMEKPVNIDMWVV